MSTKNRICLGDHYRDNYVEKKVASSGMPKPGHLLQVNTSDEVSKLGTDNAGRVYIALENWLQGGANWGAVGGVFDVYVAGDQCLCMIPRPGEVYNVRVPANAVAILKHNVLVPGTDGTISKLGGTEDAEIIGSVGPSAALVAGVTTIVPYDVLVPLPANSLNVDDVIHIQGQVTITGAQLTDTVILTIKVGTTTVYATAATDVVTGDVFVFDLYLAIRTIGASGTFVMYGTASAIGVAGTATMRAVNLVSTAIDTTAVKDVTVSQTWSVANAANIGTLTELTVGRAGTANLESGIVFTAEEALDNSAGAAEALIEARVLR